MRKNELLELLETAKQASIKAGEEILKIYGSDDFGVERKGDDSPLTMADKAAHSVIMDYLMPTEIPVLSEEGRDISYSERHAWEYLWIVDPLDGTKEFLKRNDEFTVNIALVQKREPVMGVVYCPVLDKLYYGGKDIGCYVKQGESDQALAPSSGFDITKAGCRVVASRSHLNEATRQFIEKLNQPEIVSMGSSLKFMLLAEGKADIYPRYAPTMEWDTAASHAILASLNYQVVDANSNSLKYNKENLLNPYFCAS